MATTPDAEETDARRWFTETFNREPPTGAFPHPSRKRLLVAAVNAGLIAADELRQAWKDAEEDAIEPR